MSTMQWFRMYSEFASDPKVQLLAFEDQRHFVVLLCLKCNGTLDTQAVNEQHFDRLVCKALGLDQTSGLEAKRRLREVGLIDEHWQPTAWEARQFSSDSSADRTRRWRQSKKTQVTDKQDSDIAKRHSDVTVTVQSRTEQNRTEQSRADAREREPDRAAVPVEEKKPTPEGEMATALRNEGVITTSQDVLLVRWVADGFTTQQALHATRLARQRKPYPEPVPSAYLDAILRDDKRMKPAVATPKRFRTAEEIEAEIGPGDLHACA